MARKARKPKKGTYRPVNQAGFRYIYAGPLNTKPRRGKHWRNMRY